MSERFEAKAENCAHPEEHLSYEGTDSVGPDFIKDAQYCERCGAHLITTLKEFTRKVVPREGDDSEERTFKVPHECWLVVSHPPDTNSRVEGVFRKEKSAREFAGDFNVPCDIQKKQM